MVHLLVGWLTDVDAVLKALNTCLGDFHQTLLALAKIIGVLTAIILAISTLLIAMRELRRGWGQDTKPRVARKRGTTSARNRP
jgi:hypothetical protein